MSSALSHQFALDFAAAGDTPMQICLPFTGPIGPGKVTRTGSEDGNTSLYVIETQAQMGQHVVVLPITFDAADLIWYSSGPRKQERPLVVPLSGGGLVVPRG